MNVASAATNGAKALATAALRARREEKTLSAVKGEAVRQYEDALRSADAESTAYQEAFAKEQGFFSAGRVASQFEPGGDGPRKINAFESNLAFALRGSAGVSLSEKAAIIQDALDSAVAGVDWRGDLAEAAAAVGDRGSGLGGRPLRGRGETSISNGAGRGGGGGATPTGTGAVREAGGAPPSAQGGGAGPKVHSKYADDTAVLAGQQPPRLKGPDPKSAGPHSALRWDPVNQRVYQAREFDAARNPVRDVDFTSPTYPSGRPRPDHPAPPHQHAWEVNDPAVGPRSGLKRQQKGRPL